MKKSYKISFIEKNMGKMIGYARVSTDEQNLDLQIDALIQAGCLKNDIYKDKISGAKKERPGLAECSAIIGE